MYNNVLTYDKSFTPEHHLTLVGGQEFIEYKTDYLRSGARQFEKVNFGLADMSLGASPDKVVTRLESDKMLSYFMRANYNFKEKYLLQLHYVQMLPVSLDQIISGEYFLLPHLHGEHRKKSLSNSWVSFLI